MRLAVSSATGVLRVTNNQSRRKKGTQRVGVNEEGIVEQHLKKEATNRKSSESANKEINKVCLRGVAVDQREDVASETMQDTGSMEREDNEPLPLKMSPDSAAHQVHNDQISNSELLLAIRGVEQKVDRLICQFLSYRPPPMQQRSAQVHIPPGFPVSRPAYMGHPTMATESHHEPEGQAPSQDDFFDEGYASASHHSPPTQPVEHPTGFDLLVREQCYEGQAQEKTRGDQRHVLEGVSAERMAFNRQHPGLGSMQGQPPSFFRGDNQPGVYDEANAQCSSGYGFP